MALELNHSQKSQSSSVDSIVSNSSHRQPIFDADSSPGHHRVLREPTPSTSLSNQSSQGRVESISPEYQHGISESERMSADFATAQSYIADESRSNSTDADWPQKSRAPKRTANGQTKVAAKHHKEGSEGVIQYGHSMTTGSASKGNQVSELSHELRTRLSYALFKVQRGWQSHSLNELEAMAIHKTNPSATASSRFSTFHPYYPPQQLKDVQNSVLESCLAHEPPKPQEVSHLPALHQAAITDGIRWQARNTKPTPEHRSPHHSPRYGPALAPPANILPRPRLASNARPPLLDTGKTTYKNTINTPYPAGLSTIPITPPRGSSAAIRTPSQKAAMEKDAVETLMFMSSPVNSNHHTTVRGSDTSRPNYTMTSPKQVDHIPSKKNSNVPATTIRTSLNSRKLTTTTEIDAMLDEIPDSSSSSDDEGPLL
ncbi:MAG: hypothetical protein Q9219_004310 [cf. Caloplaca sp. 3 TL-2023]